MPQGKTQIIDLAPGTSPAQRLDAVKQALIEHGVPSRHQLYLQVANYDDLHIGTWPDLYCSDADIALATTVLLAW